VVNLIEQVAGGVQASHSAGIVHRDLKPDNIMYDVASGRAKLLDFGIAADTDMAPEERLTRAGFFVGTLMYVAPEALSGELVGPAADQYSLGVITYFLLSGTLPFTARSPREMFSQLLTEKPIPLNKANPDLHFTDALERVVMRALDRSPAARYPDITQFAASLGEAAGAVELPSKGDANVGSVFDRVRSLFTRR
jgi:serine/threonine-protein kinase